MSITAWREISEKQRRFLQYAIGKTVQYNSSGSRGKITSLAVTSDGFIQGRTSPGEERGVFLGSLPSDAELKDWNPPIPTETAGTALNEQSN